MPQERKRAKFPVSFYIGSVLVVASLILLGIVFYPAVNNEFNYTFHKPDANISVSAIVAKDKDFSIVVPKIGANSKVIANVDPQNSLEYQVALTRGVAHAKGTSLPDESGNTFLFAHSSDTLLNANIFNSVFYLLNKIQKDDFFYIIYKEQIYKYKVVKTEIVAPTDVKYYGSTLEEGARTATLMTCWPPATTLKRLVVVGVLE